MNDTQFAVYTLLCGMTMEGCTKDESLIYASMMGYSSEDIEVARRKLCW